MNAAFLLMNRNEANKSVGFSMLHWLFYSLLFEKYDLLIWVLQHLFHPTYEAFLYGPKLHDQ